MRAIVSGERRLRGGVHLPGSKAYTHRALIGALLSGGETVIHDPSDCEDVQATSRGIIALGATMSRSKGTTAVAGAGGRLKPSGVVDCGESGASLRFLAPVGALAKSEAVFRTGRGLGTRPIQPLLDALRMIGGTSYVDGKTIRVHGPLDGGTARIVGNVSSQFISGLLFASPCAKSDVTIQIEGRLESKPYVEMTLEVLRQHGISVDRTPSGYHVPAPQAYLPAEHYVPRDFSSASFLMTAVVAAGGEASFSGFGPESDKLEPDRLIVGLLEKSGASIDQSPHSISVWIQDRLEAFDFDASDNPDLVPALEVLGCYAKGRSRITGTERLKFKESDRLQSVPSELSKLGGRLRVQKGLVEIEGIEKLKGTQVSSHDDHRVVMACTVAALGATGTTTIEGAEAVSKSYPGFFADLSTLGAEVHVE